MLRSLFAIISGIFATMIVTTFMALASAKFWFPPPIGMDLTNPEIKAAYIATMPVMALSVILLGWLLGAFAGAAVAATLALPHRMPCALVVGALSAVLIGLNAMTTPHPTWMVATGVLLPLPLAYLAAKLVQKGFANTR